MKATKKGHGISIIIPFRKSKTYSRQASNFAWVKKYWHCQLPGAQIIVGKDSKRNKLFSKSAAVNDGVKKATGDVLVITDADAYISIKDVLECVKNIRKARHRGRKLWYVPYRYFYRLTNEASTLVLRSSPCDPYTFSCPPPADDVQSHNQSGSIRGHWFGAMIQIVPREAFECVGGWDERFRGWGGEDSSIMRATDTLYARHRTLKAQVLHLWHPMFGTDGVDSWVPFTQRLWDNQKKPNANGNLSLRYYRAKGDIKRMRKLVSEREE